MLVYSKNINSIRNNTQKNTKSFVKIEANQSTQLWARKGYDYKRSKIFLQNIWKNSLFTNIILENQKEFNIIFI